MQASYSSGYLCHEITPGARAQVPTYVLHLGWVAMAEAYVPHTTASSLLISHPRTLTHNMLLWVGKEWIQSQSPACISAAHCLLSSTPYNSVKVTSGGCTHAPTPTLPFLHRHASRGCSYAWPCTSPATHRHRAGPCRYSGRKKNPLPIKFQYSQKQCPCMQCHMWAPGTSQYRAPDV